MNNRKLKHVIESLKNLNRKSFGESNGKTLEIVVFYKLVKIDAQHFKADADVRPKGKIGGYSHDVLAVFSVFVSESLQYFDLNLALLM